MATGYVRAAMAGEADAAKDWAPATNYAQLYKSAAATGAGLARGANAGRGSPINPDITAPIRNVPGMMDPASIYNSAADLAIQRAAIENQNLREINKILQEERTQAEQSTYGQRMGQINEEYKQGMQRSADWRASDERREQEAYNQAMMGLHIQDPTPIRNFINTYGDPNANIKDVFFGRRSDGTEIIPGNPNAVEIVFPNGKSAKFNNAKEVYAGMLFFMNPKIRGELANLNKEERKTTAEERKASAAEDANILKAQEQARKDYSTIFKMEPPDTTEAKKWMDNRTNEILKSQGITPRQPGAVQGAMQGEAQATPNQPKNVMPVRGPDGKAQTFNGKDLMVDETGRRWGWDPESKTWRPLKPKGGYQTPQAGNQGPVASAAAQAPQKSEITFTQGGKRWRAYIDERGNIQKEQIER